MSRFLKTAIVLLAIAAMAAPAFAEVTLNGYFRVQGEMNSYSGDLTKVDAESDSQWYQRFRLKMTDSLNDNVKLVYYAEADTDWGKSGKGSIGGGAKLGNDGVLIETKQAYADLSFDLFTAKVGLQGFADGLDGIFLDDDGAGMTFKSKLGMADVTLLYSKFSEGAGTLSDDFDFYGIKAGVKVSDTVNLGFNAFYFDNSASDTEAQLLVLAATAGVKLSDAMGLNGFFAYTDMSADESASEGNAWLINADFTSKLGDNGKVKFRVLYSPADDSASDNDSITDVSEFAFAGENLLILGTDGPATNGEGGGHFGDALYNGYGLLAVVLSGSYNLPEAMYMKYGVGYFAADDDAINGEAASKDGTDLGTELALTLGKKVLKNVDLSVRAGYAFIGDFYGSDADDAWKAVSMLNISF